MSQPADPARATRPLTPANRSRPPPAVRPLAGGAPLVLRGTPAALGFPPLNPPPQSHPLSSPDTAQGGQEWERSLAAASRGLTQDTRPRRRGRQGAGNR